MDPLIQAAIRVAGLLGRYGRAALDDAHLGDPVLGELLPTAVQASVVYKTWIKESRRSVADAGDVIQKPLSHDSESRRRSRLAPLVMFDGWGPRTAPVFSLYWRLLPSRTRRNLHNILTKSRLISCKSESLVLSRLKGLSAIAKKYQDILFGDDWYYYVDMHTLTDYQETLPIESFEEDIKRWCAPGPAHELDSSFGDFNTVFRAGVRKFLDKAPMNMADYKPWSISEFASDPLLWARSGTSTGPRLQVINSKGEVKRARKQKWASALAYTPQDVINMIMSENYQVNAAVQKRELAKVRAVVSSDDGMYLKMSFVDTYLLPCMAGHPETTLFYSARQLRDLFVRMWETSRNSFIIKMPMDQSEFDHQVRTCMLMICLDEIYNFISSRNHDSNRGELLSTTLRIKRGLSGGYVQVGKVKIPIKNGIMSGWKWTAFLDTMTNAGEKHVVELWVVSMVRIPPFLPGTVYQGDDIECTVHSYGVSILVWKGYTKAGFQINPKKSFISDSVDEFLRQVTYKEGVAGYPARGFTSLVWRNPVSREELRGEERVRELLTSWVQCSNRMRQALPVDMVTADIGRSIKVKPAVIKLLMQSPACLGGMGYDISFAVPSWLGITKGKLTKSWKLARTPPLASSLAKQHGLEAALLSELWVSNVEGPGTEQPTVEPFSFTTTRPFMPYRGTLSLSSSGGLSLFCRFKSDVLPSVLELKRRQFIDTRDWVSLRELVHPTSVGYFDDYLKRLTRRLFIDWLLGSLPYKVPIREGYSSLVVSLTYNTLASSAFQIACTKPRVNYSLVLRTALLAETQLDSALSSLPCKLGG